MSTRWPTAQEVDAQGWRWWWVDGEPSRLHVDRMTHPHRVMWRSRYVEDLPVEMFGGPVMVATEADAVREILLDAAAPAAGPGDGAPDASLVDLARRVASLLTSAWEARDKRDSATGHDRAPDRYTAHGRETIDRQRDLALHFAQAMVAAGPAPDLEAIADFMFVYLCSAQALRYLDRIGRKGDPAEDEAKRAFYSAMAAHVIHGNPDPRSSRPGFTPYQRQPFKVER